MVRGPYLGGRRLGVPPGPSGSPKKDWGRPPLGPAVSKRSQNLQPQSRSVPKGLENRSVDPKVPKFQNGTQNWRSQNLTKAPWDQFQPHVIRERAHVTPRTSIRKPVRVPASRPSGSRCPRYRWVPSGRFVIFWIEWF